ncbi:MAG: hypothetical protein Ct9H90mP9_2270 [Pseudomonadota bacterium]|nr:MAG: hypothetical protein Ct9H90mP9_2270 [Pseudomonadota bacterium]
MVSSFSGPNEKDPRVNYLLNEGFPFVTHGRTARMAEHDWFDIDGEKGPFKGCNVAFDQTGSPKESVLSGEGKNSSAPSFD